MSVSLDELVVKYSRLSENLARCANEIGETGQIPMGPGISEEGAPHTPEEAMALVTGMAFAAERALEDLLELKMSFVFEEAEQTEN